MNTKARILEASTSLFNQAGVAQVTCVDIAGELGISPGNLYYHFRGKEEIQVALMEEFKVAMLSLYARFEEDVTEPENFPPYVHSLLKIGHHFRFLFRDQAAFCFSEKRLQRRWQNMMRQLQDLSRKVLARMDSLKPLGLTAKQRDTLAETLVITSLASLCSEVGDNDDGDAIARRSAAVIAVLLAPYHHPSVDSKPSRARLTPADYVAQ